MKMHVSMKYVKSLWRNMWRCGYCDLQYIMKGAEPHYYNSGIYGWNCDVYCDFKHDIAISTGYRNMAGRRIPAELIQKHTDIAKAIMGEMWNRPYEQIEAELEDNRKNFFAALAAM